jgi:diacylglycerol kinase (ATP)
MDLLAAQGFEITLINASTRGQTVGKILEALSDPSGNYQRLLVAGGDGTLNTVLSALLLTKRPVEELFTPPLALLPLGTVNVLARELGIPFEITRAAQVAKQGLPRALDIGLCRQQPFILMSGIGFDGAVVSGVQPRVKNIIGAFAYVFEALRLVLAHPTHHFTLVYDGKTCSLPAWLVIIANASSYAYKMSITPEARLDDGLLDICIFPDRGRLHRIRQVFHLLTNHPERCPLLHLSARQGEIQARPAAFSQVDGDPGPELESFPFAALPGKIQIMVPSEKVWPT